MGFTGNLTNQSQQQFSLLEIVPGTVTDGFQEILLRSCNTMSGYASIFWEMKTEVIEFLAN